MEVGAAEDAQSKLKEKKRNKIKRKKKPVAENADYKPQTESFYKPKPWLME